MFLRAEVSSVDHVEHPPGVPTDDVHAVRPACGCPRRWTVPPMHAIVHLHAHVAQRQSRLLRLRRELSRGGQHQRLNLAGVGVEHLAEREGDHGRLAGARLRLRDDVAAAGDGHDRALLNRRGLLETVRVEAAKQVLADAHAVEGADHLDALGRVEGDVLILVEVHRRVPHRPSPSFSPWCVSLPSIVAGRTSIYLCGAHDLRRGGGSRVAVRGARGAAVGTIGG